MSLHAGISVWPRTSGQAYLHHIHSYTPSLSLFIGFIPFDLLYVHLCFLDCLHSDGAVSVEWRRISTPSFAFLIFLLALAVAFLCIGRKIPRLTDAM
ncbi:uncharacterized protein K460DRAFT_36952 [Cucurbitaria berberidis CBS 394.84]|uniref:Uncharacterized protein n=1 Tax=Cucurbitaria berberidis CBS 394.84 TaxID=1168544 RepID=A0A9P4GUH2_9PLEO|nr:uncharacterized protein K460DRAFT_36952 [Cucurbitaria berberidis CBS 394.84]KAF1851547.1 hypothetical protein K460DRAFT_36952 [Cucurbitaria berberidis CBS 394.84]